MGWAGGRDVMDSIIDVVLREIQDRGLQQRLFKGIIEALEDADWDTQDECLDRSIAFDEALDELHPEWDIDTP